MIKKKEKKKTAKGITLFFVWINLESIPYKNQQ